MIETKYGAGEIRHPGRKFWTYKITNIGNIVISGYASSEEEAKELAQHIRNELYDILVSNVEIEKVFKRGINAQAKG